MFEHFILCLAKYIPYLPIPYSEQRHVPVAPSILSAKHLLGQREGDTARQSHRDRPANPATRAYLPALKSTICSWWRSCSRKWRMHRSWGATIVSPGQPLQDPLLLQPPPALQPAQHLRTGLAQP